MSRLTRREFLKTTLVSAATTTAIGLASFAYGHGVEAFWVELVEIDLTLPRLAAAFDGYRIAQFSDIHMGSGVTAAYLAEVVELVNAQQPDFIAITGDFVTLGAVAPVAPGLIAGLGALRAADGVGGVLGNHDHWANTAQLRDVLRTSDVIDLNNTVLTLEREAAQLHICGVDSHWELQDRLDLVLAQLPADGAAVLLAHEPDFADISAATGRFVLQISGHSHGGQVRLPLLGAPFLPRLGRKYPMGRYQVGSMIQYTNRGVGATGPVVRIHCRPEVTVFTLRAGVAG